VDSKFLEDHGHFLPLKRGPLDTFIKRKKRAKKRQKLGPVHPHTKINNCENFVFSDCQEQNQITIALIILVHF
jgi:hypothetical protein